MLEVEVSVGKSDSKLLGVLTICGYDVKIMLVPNEHPGVDKNAGRIDYDRQIIYISNHVTKQQKYDTLLHEIQHAILYYSGAVEFLAKKVGLDRNGDEYEDFEELLVQITTPHIRTLIPQLAKLKLK